MTEPIKTTCPYCGVGCGVLVTPQDDGSVTARGDPDHPANLGRLCSKGAALGETLGTAGRLLHPTVAGGQVGWDRALDQVAARLCEIVAEHGPGAVAFYVSGQLLTEDYYVANKLMKGFIGGANIDTNSRLCMASSVAGYKRALGADTVPCDYADLESAELIVLVGSNTAWCHPVVYQRIKQAKQAHPDRQIVVIDPRRTATCEIADLHLSIAPGTDTLLFNGLLNWLRREDGLDWTFLESHTEGFAAAFTARCADVLLPAAGWGEKEGTATNSERCISRQRAFLDPPGEARPDWWILTEVARRMGFADAFPYRSAAEVFREHAALSGFENHGRRDFDIGALADLAATDTTGSPRSNGRCRRGVKPNDFSPTAAFTPRTAKHASSRSHRVHPRPRRTKTIRSCSTPAAFATSGTP